MHLAGLSRSGFLFRGKLRAVRTLETFSVAGLLLASSCAATPNGLSAFRREKPTAADGSASKDAPAYASKLDRAKQAARGDKPTFDPALQHAVIGEAEQGNPIQQLSYETMTTTTAGSADVAADDAAPATPTDRPWAPDLGGQSAVKPLNDAAVAAAVYHPACPLVDVPYGVCPPGVPAAVACPEGRVCTSAKPCPTEDGHDEYVCDGGDRGYPVHYESGAMAGLDTEDTVAEFVDEKGRRHVKPSSRVCVYSPRFGVARAVSEAVEQFAVDKATGAHDGVTPAGYTHKAAIDEKVKRETLVDARSRERLSDLDGTQTDGLVTKDAAAVVHAKLINAFEDYAFAERGEIDRSEQGLLFRLVAAAGEWQYRQPPRIVAQDLAGQQVEASAQAEEYVGIEDLRKPGELRIVKLADRQSAQIGETVTFNIRFDNLGGKELYSVRILDNLSPRLELIPESVKCQLDGDLELAEDPSGGSLLTFTLKEPLKGKTGGSLTFECRIR